MVHTCCVPLCASNSRRTNNNISYFNFPDSVCDKGKLRRQWLKRIRRFRDSSWKPLANTKTCSEHFDESDYRGINKLPRSRRLKKNAVLVVLGGHKKSKEEVTLWKSTESVKHKKRLTWKL